MHPLFWSLSIFCWQDIAEITLLCLLFLYINHWCQRDMTHPLLIRVYGYTALYITANACHMPTLTTLLALFAPVYAVILTFTHQESLQKSFLPVRVVSDEHNNWPEIALQTTLVAASNNMSLLYVIEQKDHLEACITKRIECNAPLTKELIALLTNSTAFTSDHLLIITTSGTLAYIAHGWKKDSLEAWFSQDYADQEPWIQEALLFTTKTDAIVFRYDLIARTFTIVANATIRRDVNASALLTYLQSSVDISPSLPIHERKPYVTQSHQSTSYTNSSF